jgi:hypothetical protein
VLVVDGGLVDAFAQLPRGARGTTVGPGNDRGSRAILTVEPDNGVPESTHGDSGDPDVPGVGERAVDGAGDKVQYLTATLVTPPSGVYSSS